MYFFTSIYTDLKHLKLYERIILTLFGIALVVFSFIDFNALIYPDAGLSIYSWVNDKNYGYNDFERGIKTLSGVASFTGALTVVMTAKGLYSCFFWGYINVIIYGIFAFVYGYSGDAQLNIMFYFPMMIYGQYVWSNQLRQEVVRMKFITSYITWLLVISLAIIIGVIFYYEIPAFSKAIEGYYIFDTLYAPHILDAGSNACSIIGQLLLNGRYSEQWIFWIISNCMQISMYAGVAGFGVDINILLMFCLFQLNAIRGLYVWYKANYVFGYKTKKGMIIGKFYPFHVGHKALIQYGLANCDFLTVVVSYKKNESISGPDRFEMIRKTFYEEIEEKFKLELQLREDLWPDKDDDSEHWAKKAIEYLDGFKPNVVFTSEKYGDTWAACIGSGCQHMLFDIDRTNHNISGTRIRENPYDKNIWTSYLPESTKDYFRIKVVLIGAESTGKTTLAKSLSNHYNAPLVLEYAREYLDKENSENKRGYHVDDGDYKVVTMDYSIEDFDNIASKQEKLILEQCTNNPDSRIVICDTDGFVTYFWLERYLPEKKINTYNPVEMAKINSIKNKLLSYRDNGKRIYLFSKVNDNTPFIQDGTRDGANIRQNMSNSILSFIETNNVKYFTLSDGSYNEREVVAREIIDKLVEGTTKI